MALDKYISLLTTVTEYEMLYTVLTLAVLLIVVPVFMVMAFFGFKMFKLETILYGIIFGYIIGENIALALFSGVISWPYFSMVVGIVFAIIGGIISIFVHKFSIFLTGFGHGYMFATSVVTILFSNVLSAETLELATIVISSIVGAVCGYFFLKYHKQLIIISTSFIYPYVSLLCVDLVISINNPEIMSIGVIISVILGTILGILAMRWQFKDTKDFEY